MFRSVSLFAPKIGNGREHHVELHSTHNEVFYIVVSFADEDVSPNCSSTHQYMVRYPPLSGADYAVLLIPTLCNSIKRFMTRFWIYFSNNKTAGFFRMSRISPQKRRAGSFRFGQSLREICAFDKKQSQCNYLLMQN